MLDGYRAVAPHLAEQPGAEVLIVTHGLKSVPLYAALAGHRPGRRDASTSRATTTRCSRSPSASARVPYASDFGKPERRYPIVVDAGLTAEGLSYAIRSTEPEGICQSVSFYAGGDMPLPLGRLYTLGIRFFIGRAHAVALLPEVMPLIEQGRLRPAGGDHARRRLGGRPGGVPGAGDQADRPARVTREAADTADVRKARLLLAELGRSSRRAVGARSAPRFRSTSTPRHRSQTKSLVWWR